MISFFPETFMSPRQDIKVTFYQISLHLDMFWLVYQIEDQTYEKFRQFWYVVTNMTIRGVKW